MPNKECYSCRHYSAYYTKGFCSFSRENFGFCSKKGEILEKHGICECWRSKYTSSRLRKVVARRKLDEALDSITIIRQILAEEDEP